MKPKSFLKPLRTPLGYRTTNIYGVLVLLTVLFVLIVVGVRSGTGSTVNELKENRSPTGAIESIK